MNIYLNLDGTAQIITLQPIYQGSNNVTNIVVQSYLSGLTAMEVYFTLPDKDRTVLGPFPMQSTTPISGTETLNYWELPLERSITALAGEVGIVINAISNTAVSQNLASFKCHFMVIPGILPIPPEIPDAESWELLLKYYQDNAYNIEKLKQRLQEKTLLDFTVNSETGQGTKFYSDGTTANIQFPSGGGELPDIKSDWLRVLNFNVDSFALQSDGSYALAFGSEQTGFSNNEYLAILDSFGERSYEAGMETQPSTRQGFNQLADTFFKGNDGSLLIHGVSVPFDGRLTLLGGSVFSGKLLDSWTYDANTSIATVSYIDGETEEYQLPKPQEAQRYEASYNIADWQGESAPYTIIILEEEHQKGTNPSWRFYYNQVFDVDVNNSGDMTVSTNTKKDMKIIIL